MYSNAYFSAFKGKIQHPSLIIQVFILLPMSEHLNWALSMNWVGNNFNPVTIRISDECDVVHLSFLELLDKGHTLLLKAIACLLNIINSDTDVSKTSAGVLVTIGVTSKLRV